MNANRIKLMHQLFGKIPDKQCKTCNNLVTVTANRRYNKCRCYSQSHSASSDWRQKWTACGLYNKEYDGSPVKEYKKHMSRNKLEVQCDGQMSLFDIVRDNGLYESTMPNK